jgi:general secretion pathway protein J
MRRPVPSAAGFTLMEVMIAVAIVSLMGGLIYGSFGPLLRAKEVIEAESEHYRALQVSLSRMSREASMAFISTAFDHARYRDKHDMPTFFTGERDRLSFTAFAHQRRYKDAKESDQAIFEYKMGRDPNEALGSRTGDVLMRREKAILDEEYSRGGVEQVLSEDVKKLRFAYYDDQKHEWVEEWDTRRDRDRLPERVKITVVSTDETGKDREYTTEARIYMRLAIEH